MARRWKCLLQQSDNILVRSTTLLPSFKRAILHYTYLNTGPVEFTLSTFTGKVKGSINCTRNVIGKNNTHVSHVSSSSRRSLLHLYSPLNQSVSPYSIHFNSLQLFKSQPNSFVHQLSERRNGDKSNDDLLNPSVTDLQDQELRVTQREHQLKNNVKKEEIPVVENASNVTTQQTETVQSNKMRRKKKVSGIASNETIYPLSAWTTACELPYMISGHNNVGLVNGVEPEMQLIGGFDEAGRGAVLGPLILSLVIFPSTQTPQDIISTLPIIPPEIASSLKSSTIDTQVDATLLASPSNPKSSSSPYNPTLSENLDGYFRRLGVKDSKRLTLTRRSGLMEVILPNCIAWRVLVFHADEIDRRRKNGENLNQITLHGLLALLQSLSHTSFNSPAPLIKQSQLVTTPSRIILAQLPISISHSTLSYQLSPPNSDHSSPLPLHHLYIDSFDPISTRLHSHLSEILSLPSTSLTCTAGADNLYLSVSAASIIAKHMRDLLFDNLIKTELRLDGDVGSGYPSDKKTRRWLEGRKGSTEVPVKLIRKSWKIS